MSKLVWSSEKKIQTLLYTLILNFCLSLPNLVGYNYWFEYPQNMPDNMPISCSSGNLDSSEFIYFIIIYSFAFNNDNKAPSVSINLLALFQRQQQRGIVN